MAIVINAARRPDERFSTEDHQLEFTYAWDTTRDLPEYGISCSCGLREQYTSWVRFQNLTSYEVMSWMAYRHTGKAERWRRS